MSRLCNVSAQVLDIWWVVRLRNSNVGMNGVALGIRIKVIPQQTDSDTESIRKSLRQHLHSAAYIRPVYAFHPIIHVHQGGRIPVRNPVKAGIYLPQVCRIINRRGICNSDREIACKPSAWLLCIVGESRQHVFEHSIHGTGDKSRRSQADRIVRIFWAIYALQQRNEYIKASYRYQTKQISETCTAQSAPRSLQCVH